MDPETNGKLESSGSASFPPRSAVPQLQPFYEPSRNCDRGRPYNGLGNGCVLAALGADVARKGPAVRHAVTEGLRPFIGLSTRTVPGRSRVVRRRRALGMYASLIGAMVLARAVDDPALSKQILQAVAASLQARSFSKGIDPSHAFSTREMIGVSPSRK